MEISKQFAMEMVKELGGILSQNINFIDRNGIIIASTDTNRINTVHMGAKRIMDEGLPFLVIDSDEEYTGSKKGINLPIIVDNQIQGIIGITGDRNVVVKYGEIIKRFTEMYIRDNKSRKQHQLDEKMRSRFIENWLTSENASQDPYFMQGANQVGLNLNVARRIVLISFSQLTTQNMTDSQLIIDQATQYLRASLCDKVMNHTMRIGSVLVFLLEASKELNFKEKLERIAFLTRDAYGLEVFVGFDTQQSATNQLSDTYRHAQKALLASQASHATSVMEYSELFFELFISDISDATRREFVSKVFGKVLEEERLANIPLLELLYLNNGSIEQTAKQLFIHKNTLQYKLRKIKDQSGMDPRDCRFIPIFSLAILFLKRI